MNWSVGRRMAAGYAVILLFMLGVAAVGMLALSRTTEMFRTALVQLEHDLSNALQAEIAFRAPNISFLRYLTTADDEFLKAYGEEVTTFRQLLVDLATTSPNQGVKTGWERMHALLDTWDGLVQTSMAARKAGRTDEAVRLRGQAQLTNDQLVAQLRRLVEAGRRDADEASRKATSDGSRAYWLILGVAAVALATGVIVATTSIRAITNRLRETIASLGATSSQILAATSQQAAGTAEEVTAVQETSTTVDEVRQTAVLSAQKAGAVTETVQRSAQISVDGRRAVEDSTRGMQEMKARMEAIAERILGLSQQGQAVGEIIVVVSDLAEQSNLLAVNAAIEAAKAGDVGKGFAVVAAEVKALAEQSKQATAQVRTILTEIQRATQSAVMATEQGVKASEAGVGAATRAGEAVRQLGDSLAESAQAAQQILVSARQQQAGVDQVALAMQNIRQASTQNMTSTRQMERAARDLTDLAGQLKALVATV